MQLAIVGKYLKWPDVLFLATWQLMIDFATVGKNAICRNWQILEVARFAKTGKTWSCSLEVTPKLPYLAMLQPYQGLPKLAKPWSCQRWKGFQSKSS